MNIRTLIPAVALLAATGFSNAATISFNASQGPTLTDFTFNLVLSKFDTTLGTLTGATIRFTATDDIVSINLANQSNSAQTFRFTSTADFLLTANTADSTLVGTDLQVTNFNSGLITLGASGTPVCPAATPSAACSNVTYLPPAATGNTGDVSVTILNNYKAAVGSTTFTLTGNTLTGSTFVGGGGNVSSNQVTNATAAAIVTYTYSPNVPTPEPVTFSLMGISLLGLALIRRKA